MGLLQSRKRVGLFAEHRGAEVVCEYEVRATIPAIERLREAGAECVPLGPPDHEWRIVLGKRMPEGIVAVHVQGGGYSGRGIRLADEPPYPGESRDYWAQVAWTPCPVCGAAVVWYEAGYVPGYRVCSRPPHHHSLARQDL